MIPDRTIHLYASVKGRSPRTILDEGLTSVPTLSPFVLHLRYKTHLTCLDGSAVSHRIILTATLLTTLCSNDDHAVCCAATIESSSCCAFEHCKCGNIVRRNVAYTSGSDSMTLCIECRVGDRHTINHVERLVRTVD